MSLISKKKLSLAVAMAAGLAVPGLASATNGYFAHGYGTQTKGLAGAGVAFSQDSLAAATNPAGMVLVGERFDIGVAAFSPIREYTASGTSGPQPPPAFNLANGTVESDNELFFIPHLGYNWMLDKNNSIGISVYGNGGMNTDYPAAKTGGGLGTFFGFGGATGVNLMQLFVSGTYAHKFAPNSAVGASLIGVYQRFEAFGLQNFAPFSTSPSNLSNNGSDSSTGFGGKVGGQFDVGGGVALGASYQTKMRMSEFDKYKGLFAEQGDFDIPATGIIGAAFNFMPGHTLVFDIQRIFYSDVDAIANPIANLFTCPPGSGAPSCLGGSNGAGFGWEDMTIYKLGYQFKVNPQWTVRAGYSQGDQPIPSSEVLFNILAPAVVEDHYTLGFTWNMDKKNEINFAAMYAPSKSQSGPNPLAAGGQTISIEMKQYELEISWGMKF